MSGREFIRRYALAALAALALGSFALVAQAEPSAPSGGEGGVALATFAGGCFWCMEGPFDALDGVISTTSGYTGGQVQNPTYEQVSAGTTGHAEAVEIRYDPNRVTYEQLLHVFWRNIDPTTPDRQFCDRGSQYRPAIFYHDEAQHSAARASREEVLEQKSFKDDIRVEIAAATPFYAAEDYHQDYYLKNPVRYKFYRYNCGRDRRLEQLWGESH